MVAVLGIALAVLAVRPGATPERSMPPLAWCCALGTIPPLLDLSAAAPPAVLVLPLGPPGAGIGSLSLGLDLPGAMLLLLAMIAGVSGSLGRVLASRRSAALTLLLTMAILAADAIMLAVALGLLALAGSHRRSSGIVILCAAFCAAGPLASGATSFALLRQPGLMAGSSGAPVSVAALLALSWVLIDGAAGSRAVGLIGGLCLVLRLPGDAWAGNVLDQPVGVAVMILAGLGFCCWSGWRGLRALDLRLLWRRASLLQFGVVCIAIGMSGAARLAALPSVAAAAHDAAWLLAIGAALTCATSEAVVAAIARQAGQTRLDRIGGLLRQMPWAGASLLAAAAGLAGLPPLLGFAGLWLLVQVALAAPYMGSLPVQVVFVLLLAAIAAAQSAAVALALRGIVPALLGRPRTPRGAAAEEAETPARLAAALPAGLLVLTGLAPGGILTALGRAPGHAAWLGIGSPSGAGYAPLPLVVLAAAGVGAAFLLLRHPALRAPGGAAEGAVWEEGAPPPPPWLPFGDPEAQQGAGLLRPPDMPSVMIRWRWRTRPALRTVQRGAGPWPSAAVVPAAALVLVALLLLVLTP